LLAQWYDFGTKPGRFAAASRYGPLPRRAAGAVIAAGERQSLAGAYRRGAGAKKGFSFSHETFMLALPAPAPYEISSALLPLPG
jgi:hypothetical protein